MFLTLIAHFTIPILIVIVNVMWAQTEKEEQNRLT